MISILPALLSEVRAVDQSDLSLCSVTIYRRNYFLFEATSFSFQVKLFFFPHFKLTLNSAFVLKWRQSVAADEHVVGYCWFLQVAI